VGGAL